PASPPSPAWPPPRRLRPPASSMTRPTTPPTSSRRARALEQVNNQIRSLQNEAQMLMQGAQNLTSLDVSALAELRANLAETQSLIVQAQGLTFDVGRLEGQFDQLYPATTAAGTDGQTMAAQARERWTASL